MLREFICRASLMFCFLISAYGGLADESRKVVGLRVGVHFSLKPVLDTSSIDTVLQRASKLMQISDNNQDFSCLIEFVRSGAVEYGSDIPILVGNNSLVELQATGLDLLFVPGFAECSSAQAGVVGCTWPGVVSVVDAAYVKDDLVVAHELGHLKNLRDLTIKKRIMFYMAKKENRSLSGDECGTMLENDSKFFDSSPDKIGTSPGGGEGIKREYTSIDELLDADWQHGVASVLPEIQSLEVSELDKARTAAASGDVRRRVRGIWIIALRGTDDDAYLWDEILATRLGDDWKIVNAKVNALQALGIFYRRTNSAEAKRLFDKYREGSASSLLAFPSDVTEMSEEHRHLSKVSSYLIRRATKLGEAAGGIVSGFEDKSQDAGSSLPDAAVAREQERISRVREAGTKGNLEDVVRALVGGLPDQ
ncbi:UNVERIFIED_ORG: hypothetical protein J2W74_002035 [Methylorubrum zatmanii]